MQKTKILAVAPYEGLADAISTIAQTRDDIKKRKNSVFHVISGVIVRQ